MALKKIDVITNKQIAEKGVQALADRPNLTGQYGTSGLSPAQLKQWFDKLATFLAERINTIINALSAQDAANYIRIALEDAKDLGEVVNSFENGTFASRILKLYPSVSATDMQALQSIINCIAEDISNLKEQANNLSLDKLTVSREKHIVYSTNQRGEQILMEYSSSSSDQLPVRTTERQLQAKTLEDDNALAHNEDLINRAYFNEKLATVNEKISQLDGKPEQLLTYNEADKSLKTKGIVCLYDSATKSLTLVRDMVFDAETKSLTIK